jgi:lactate 2-monooxygenase
MSTTDQKATNGSKEVPGIPQSSKYGAFQNEIYQNGIMHGKQPIVTTDPNKLEEQARSKLSPGSYNYVAGGAGERATMDANRLAFRQWKMVPRMLRSTTPRDLTVELFGEKYGSSHLPKLENARLITSQKHPC